jgi:hypothetical protein
MQTSVISEAGTLEREMAALMAVAPSSGAGTVRKEPLNWGQEESACSSEIENIL